MRRAERIRSALHATCAERIPSAPALIVRRVFAVMVICSDPACWEQRELLVESLDELDEGACDCGYALQVVRIAQAFPVTPRGA